MVGMSNANYELLGLTKGTSRKNIMTQFSKKPYHPNKGGSKNQFGPYFEAFRRIRDSLPPTQPVTGNNGRRTAAAGNITAFKAKVINNFFRTHKPMNLVPGPGNTTLAVVPAKVIGEPPKLIEAPAAVNEAVNAGKKLPAFVRHNTSYNGLGVGRKNNTKPPLPTQQPGKPSFWNRFKGVGRPSMPSIGRPSMPSFGFGGLFKSARQKAINAGNFMPSNAFNGAKNGYEYKTNRHGRGYYRLGSFYTKNPIKGLPAMGPVGPVAIGFPVPNNGNKGPGNKGNNGPKNMITGNGGGGRGGGGSTRVRTGNVRTGATRIGNVKSTSGSSRVEGVRGGSSQSEGGRGGTGGSISFAPVIKVNVPQAAAQSAVQALPAQERLALTNAGGYSSAAAAVANAGGPATVERAIAALNANGGNVNAAMQKTGLPRQVFNNVNKLGGPVTARRTLTAVKKVTVKTAPYVGPSATRRVAQNVYALAPVKKPRKKRMEVQLAELNRVINAVKKKKLTSLVAHNVTKTNIHANENRLKSYYKRVIKAAILKRPFAKIARGHAKKLVSSAPAKKPRRKTTPTNYPTYV